MRDYLLFLLMLSLAVCQADNRIANGSFEVSEDWICTLRNGATGNGSISSEYASDGEKSFCLEKNNGIGFVQLQNTRPIRVEKGKRYVFRGKYFSLDSEFSTLLLFRITSSPDEQLSYDAVDRSVGYTSQSFLANANPGSWNKRAIHFEAKTDGEIYLNVVLYGNPATAWLDELEFKEADYKIAPPSAVKRETYPYTSEEVYEILSKRSAASAYVKGKDFYLNGEKIIPVFYKAEPYPENYPLRRYTEFAESGVPMMFCPVRFSKSFSVEGIATEEGAYDFKRLEELLMQTLRHTPQANIIVEYNFAEPYSGWSAKYPEECWMNAKGERGYGLWGNMEGFTKDLSTVKVPAHLQRWSPWWYPSYSSKQYQQDMIKVLTDITTELMRSPLGKAVVGFQLSGGHDGQLQVPSYDYCAPEQEAFRNWVKQQYGGIKQVNSAWKTSYRSFEKIKVPPNSKLPAKTSLGQIDLTSDYRRFQEYKSWYLRDIFSTAIKQAAGKPVVVSAYGLPISYEYRDALALESLDMIAEVSWYPNRKPGYPLGAKPSNSYALHNKIWLMELDTRTWLYGGRDEVYDMWLSPAKTPEAWAATEKKMTGVSLAAGYGWWYYTMNRYFDDPRIMAEIKTTMAATEKLQKQKSAEFRPDVCLVKSVSNHYLEATPATREITVLPTSSLMFELSGVPYDSYCLEDILGHPQLQDYRVYIFMHNPLITDKQLKQIEEKLKNNNKTLVWVYNTGYLNENISSVGTMSKLSGINIKTSGQSARRTPVLTKHSLTENAQPFQGISELMCAMMAVTGKPEFFMPGQEFWIEDDKTEQLAVYQENGKTCMAMKKFPAWTSIYCAAPYGLTNRMIHNIAANAGAYVCGKPGQSIFMSGNFMSLHGIKPETYTIVPPPGTNKIYDLFTGQEIINRQIDIKVGRTYWLEFR